jgi:hypothetical protein
MPGRPLVQTVRAGAGLFTDVRKEKHSMSVLTAFTLLHVLISIIAIVAGFVAMSGWLRQRPLERWTLLFLGTTIATSVTGFMFPFTRFLPSHAFGIISLLILPLACVARYKHHLAGNYRRLYIVTSVTALYLNMFVLIVQLFLKVPALSALAPTQSEPPFAIAQGLNLVFFIGLGVAVTRKSKLPWVTEKPAPAVPAGKAA